MGGIEHIPIHHTNEIAQSESAHGVEMAHYWVHNEHLLVDGGKMSKSEGTSYVLEDIVNKGFSPIDLRYFFLQAHYRSKQNFTWEALESSKTTLRKIYRDIITLRKESGDQVGAVDLDYKQRFTEKIEDDINIPQALAVFHDLLKSDLPAEDTLITAYDFDRVLGLGLQKYEDTVIEISPELKELLKQRQKARENKDFETSDRLRDEIAVMGYLVSDSGGEQNISKK